VEAETSVRLMDRAAAESVADHLVTVLVHSVRLPDIPVVHQAVDDADGSRTLTCTVGGFPSLGSDPASLSVNRRRYRWDFAAEDPRAGTVELQIQPYAGTRNLSVSADVEDMTDDRQSWLNIAPETVARGIKKLTIEFRQVYAPDAGWQEDPGDAWDLIACRIRVEVGRETVERIVVPPVNAPVLGQQEAPQ